MKFYAKSISRIKRFLIKWKKKNHEIVDISNSKANLWKFWPHYRLPWTVELRDWYTFILSGLYQIIFLDHVQEINDSFLEQIAKIYWMLKIKILKRFLFSMHSTQRFVPYLYNISTKYVLMMCTCCADV